MLDTVRPHDSGVLRREDTFRREKVTVMETMQRHENERRGFEAERDAYVQKCVRRKAPLGLGLIDGAVFVCAGCKIKRRD